MKYHLVKLLVILVFTINNNFLHRLARPLPLLITGGDQIVLFN